VRPITILLLEPAGHRVDRLHRPFLEAKIGGPDPTSKKADVVEHPEVFLHVGLLVNGPPGLAGLPFI
jgi:hypothetical protein